MSATEVNNGMISLSFEASRSIETSFHKKWIAEFIGTFFLVFAGTGAVIVDTSTHSLTHVGVAITFGLVVMTMIYAFGHVSGAHFNPAVTLAFYFLKQINMKDALTYIFIQCLSAYTASLTLYFMFGNIGSLGATLPSGSWIQSAVMELILTFVLMMVILTSAVHDKASKPFAGIAIGGTVALEAMFGGPVSGASMNPARSIGPALASGNVGFLWIYIVFTIIGALAASAIYKLIQE